MSKICLLCSDVRCTVPLLFQLIIPDKLRNGEVTVSLYTYIYITDPIATEVEEEPDVTALPYVCLSSEAKKIS